MSIILTQSSNGYRYSIDSFLLADFCSTDKDSNILDLGSGCGIVPILLSKSCPKSQIVGIEIQRDLIQIANQNLHQNKLFGKIRFINGDIRKISSFFSKEEFEIVVSNPPYYKIGDGRINPDFRKASARHEISGCLKDFISAGLKVLKPKGSFYIIYPAKRAPELISEFMRFGLEPKVLRNIHAKEDSEANLILLRAIKMGKPGLKILPPIYIFKGNGKYSNEIEEVLKRWNFI